MFMLVTSLCKTGGLSPTGIHPCRPFVKLNTAQTETLLKRTIYYSSEWGHFIVNKPVCIVTMHSLWSVSAMTPLRQILNKQHIVLLGCFTSFKAIAKLKINKEITE